MTQSDFDRLPGLVERKEFVDGSGLGEDDVNVMRNAWLESKDPLKHDLSPQNVQRMLDAGMLPVWVPAEVAARRKRKRKRYAKYYKVVLALIARFRM